MKKLSWDIIPSLDEFLFQNKEVEVEGNWYAPKEYLLSLPGVVHVEYINTSSSAGDWNGFFVQYYKGNSNYYVIPFSQVNNFPKSGFTLYTGMFLEEMEEFNKSDIPHISRNVLEEMGL